MSVHAISPQPHVALDGVVLAYGKHRVLDRLSLQVGAKPLEKILRTA